MNNGEIYVLNNSLRVTNEGKIPVYIGASDIITDGLKLHWDFGNTISYPGTGTDVTDLSVSGGDGTISNLTFTDNYVTFPKVQGQCLFIKTPASGPVLQTNWTYSIWFKLNEVTNPYSGYLLQSRNPSEYGSSLYENTGTAQTVLIGNGSTFIVNANMTKTFNTTDWYNLTMVATPTSVKVYYGTNEEYSVTFSTNTPLLCDATRQLKVGNYTYNGTTDYWLSANVSKVYAYERALTTDEISTNNDIFLNRFAV